MTLRTGSFCSGIAAPEMGARGLGFSPQWFSEIDPFASAVLAHRHPGVPNLGDMTALKGSSLAPVDLVCAGTPCQSFSVAGLRKGMADPRGNLALVFLRLIDELRPAWVVWENVPGVLSSNSGRDFGAFLGGLGQLGYGFAYRVLDAQYVRVHGHEYAVPQRRRRVFVVGYLGDWRRAAAVLFERNCLSGNPAPSREAGQAVAGTIKACAGRSGTPNGAEEADRLVVANSLGANAGRNQIEQTYIRAASTGDVSHCLNAGGMGRQDYETETLIAHTLKGEGFDASEDGTGRGVPLVAVPFDTTQITSKANYSNPQPGDPCHPLARTAHAPAIAYTIHGTDKTAKVASVTDVCGSLRTKPPGSIENSSTTVIAFAQNQRDEIRQMEVAGALAAEPGMKQQTYLSGGYGVRRLTPLECERLQGFPDNYTLIDRKGKPAADGPRYRAIGNSMATNVMRWIQERIQMVEAL